jgi:uncharacterized protein
VGQVWRIILHRINCILQNEKFKEYIRKNQEQEINRQFCHHDMQHFLDVARIAYIKVLENKLEIEKDIVYACALLHDIGRWLQYETGIPHEKAGVQLGLEILIECGYEEQEIECILKAIGNHRNSDNLKNSLSELLYSSDKLSRSCFKCNVYKECKWSNEKKNNIIKY